MNSQSQFNREETNRILSLLGFIIFLNGLGSGVAFPIIPLLGPIIGVSAFFSQFDNICWKNISYYFITP